MKRIYVFVALAILFAERLHSQQAYLWLRLSENRVITNAEFRDVVADTLVLSRGGRIFPVPLNDIVLLRVMSSSSMLTGVAIGAGSGLAVGGLVGSSLKAMDKPGPATLTTMVIFTVVGGIVGGTVSALEKEGDVVDVTAKSAAEKREVILALIKACSIDRK